MSSELEDYLHRQIPITAAMGVRVLEATVDRVRLFAPLAPNINHRETVFGGSAAAVATLAAWTLILVRLRHQNVSGRLVIARNRIEYLLPIKADFTAVSCSEDLQSWPVFLAGIRRKGKGRVSARAALHCDDQRVADFEGQFAALLPTPS